MIDPDFFYVCFIIIPSSLIVGWVVYRWITTEPNQVRGSDRPWLYDDPSNRLIINGYVILDRLSRPDLVRLLKERILPGHDRMQKFVTYRNGVPCWEQDPTFDVQNQVQIHPSACTKAELEALLGEIYNRPFPPHRPP